MALQSDSVLLVQDACSRVGLVIARYALVSQTTYLNEETL